MNRLNILIANKEKTEKSSLGKVNVERNHQIIKKYDISKHR